jgi:protein ImuA
LRLDGGRVDAALGGGLGLAACHEIYGAGTGAGATAFALMLALANPRPGPILWVSDGWDGNSRDGGRLHGAGLAELGGDPGRLWLVAAGGVVPMLRAAGEAQRCGALACVVIESHGEAKAIDLTVTRRLQLAAAAHGVFTLLLRSGAPRPSAASTRWQAEPAPARRLAAGAPGPPRLAITLTRQRGGPADISLALEWDRDRCSFIPAESRVATAIPIGAAFAKQPPHPGAGPAVAASGTPGKQASGRGRRSAA